MRCAQQYIDRKYKFPNLRIPYRNKKYNNKIGSLDLETLSINNTFGDGLGIQDVYAGVAQ